MARKQRRSKQPQQPIKVQPAHSRDWYRLSAELREWFKVISPYAFAMLVTSSQPLKNWVA